VMVNCVSPVVLASKVLPGMCQRRSGAMIITGSIAGRQPLPRHAMYAATKVFDLYFGEALWAELRGTGVDVLVLEPGPTESEFREVAGETREVGAPAAFGHTRLVQLAARQLHASGAALDGRTHGRASSFAADAGGNALSGRHIETARGVGWFAELVDSGNAAQRSAHNLPHAGTRGHRGHFTPRRLLSRYL